jgi:hypothetical protein
LEDPGLLAVTYSDSGADSRAARDGDPRAGFKALSPIDVNLLTSGQLARSDGGGEGVAAVGVKRRCSAGTGADCRVLQDDDIVGVVNAELPNYRIR